MTKADKERMLSTLERAKKAVDLAYEEAAALFTDKAKWDGGGEYRNAIDAAYEANCAARAALSAAGCALEKAEATPDGEDNENKGNEED